MGGEGNVGGGTTDDCATAHRPGMHAINKSAAAQDRI